MHGIDLVLPDFTYLRENGDRIVGCIATHGHEDHVGGLSYLLRELSFPIFGSALTLGLARNRIEEAGPARQDRARHGARRRAPQDRPVRREFIPVTHSVPHAFATALHTPAGRDPALGRLQARPHPGRRPPHRPGPHRRARVERAASGCCWPTPPTPRSTGHAPSETRRGRRAAPPLQRGQGPAGHHGQLRQPHPPHPADRRRRHRLRARRRHARPVDPQERAPGARPRAAPRSPTRRSSTSRTVDDYRPSRCASSRPAARASRCRRCRSWPRARTAG